MPAHQLAAKKLNAIYGTGGYFLPLIQGDHSVDYLCSDLSDTERVDFLENPRKKDITYHCKARLFSIYYEFKNYLSDFEERWKKNIKQVYHCSFPISKVKYEDKIFYTVDLNELTCSDGSYWVVLVDTQHSKHPKEIAYVFIDKRSTTLYTRSPLIIEGPKQIPALTVHSTSEIQIASSLNTDNSIWIFASAFTQHRETEFNTQNVLIFCQQRCELNANIYARDLMVKAGEIAQLGTLELKNEAIFFAEKVKNSGDILAQQKISSVSLEWIDTEDSHMHSPGIIRRLSVDYTHEGLISTNQLQICAVRAYFLGQIYSALETCIHADLHLDMALEAQFILSGTVYETSNWGIDACGKTLFVAKNLSVGWKELNVPYVDFILSKMEKHALKGMNIISYVPPPTQSMTDKLLENYRKKPKPQHMFNMYAKHYLNLEGLLVVQNADLSLGSQNFIKIEGSVWSHGYSHEYQNFIHCQSLDFRGDVQLSTDLQILASKNVDHTGLLTCNTLSINTKNIHVHRQGVLRIKDLVAKIENNITLDKDSTLEIIEKLVVQCRNFYNYTLLKSPMLYIEAERLIYNWRGRFEGKTHNLVAPWIFILGNIKVHQLSMTTIGSLVIGSTQCALFSNNSLICFTPSLSLQTAIVKPNLLSLGIIGLNISCLALNAIHPPTIILTAPALIALNGVSRAASIYSQVSHLLAITQHPPTTGKMLKKITAINQLALSLCSLGLIAYGNYQSVNQSKTLSVPSPDLKFIVERSAVYLLQSMSGYSNVSILAIDRSLFLGISSANYNFLSLRFGSMLGISENNNSLFMLDSSYNFTLGPSSSNGWGLYDTGYTLALLGQNSITYQHPILDPIIPIPYLFTNIQAMQLNFDRDIQFQDSNVNATLVKNNHQLELVSTQYSFQTMDNAKQGVFYTERCNVEGNIVNNQGNIFHANSNINYGVIDNQNKLHFQNTQYQFKTLNNGSQGVMYAEGCDAASKSVNNQGVMLQSNSKINYDQVHNQNKLQIIKSTGKLGDVEVDPKTITAIDLSQLEINNLHVPLEADVGIRSMQGTIHHIEDQGNVVIENSTLNQEVFENKNINFVNTVPTGQASPQPAVQGDFSKGILYYNTPESYHISHDIISVVPVDWSAASIPIDGNPHATTDLGLHATIGDVNFQHGNMSVNGDTMVEAAANTRFNESNLLSQGVLLINAKNEVYNNASNLWAQKDVYVHGEHGVESTPKIEYATSKNKHWQWHGLYSGYVTTTETHPVAITQPTCVSATGKVRYEAPEGAILSAGSRFYAALGIEFDASGPVLLGDLRVQGTSYTQSFSLFGYQSARDSYEISVPTQLSTLGVVKINTPSDVYGTGTEVNAKQLLINGKTATFEKPILNHHHSSRNIGLLALSSPLFKHKIDLNQVEPLIQTALHLGHATSDLGRITGAENLSIHMVNELNVFMTALKHAMEIGSDGSWANLYLKPKLLKFITQMFRVDFKFGVQNNTLDYQTLGKGEFNVEKTEINAQKISFLNAFDLKGKTAILNAPEVIFSGAPLQRSARSNTNAFSLGIDIFGEISGSIEHENSVSNGTHYVQNTPQLENLIVNTKHFVLQATDLSHVKKVSGDIQKTDIITEQDVFSSKFESTSLSSEGQLNYLSQSKHNQSEHHVSLGMNVLSSTKDVIQPINVSIGSNHQPDITLALPIVNLERLSEFRDNLHWTWNQMFSEPAKTTVILDPDPTIIHPAMNVLDPEQRRNKPVFPIKYANHHLHAVSTGLMKYNAQENFGLFNSASLTFHEKQKAPSPLILAYATAVVRGTGRGLIDLANFVFHPLEELKPIGLITYDAIIIAAKHTPSSAYVPSLSRIQQLMQHHPRIYSFSKQRMHDRVVAIRQAYQTFKTASGPARVETLTESGVSVFGPGWFIKGAKAVSQIHELGVLNPPKFHPIWVDDIVWPLNPIRHLSPADIAKINRKNTLPYVITGDGELRISTCNTLRQPKEFMVIGHLLVSNLEPVYAAGDVVVKHGKIISIDNGSGHFQPFGDHLSTLVPKVFLRNGHNISPDIYKNYEESLIDKAKQQAAFNIIPGKPTHTRSRFGWDHPPLVEHSRIGFVPHWGLSILSTTIFGPHLLAEQQHKHVQQAFDTSINVSGYTVWQDPSNHPPEHRPQKRSMLMHTNSTDVIKDFTHNIITAAAASLSADVLSISRPIVSHTTKTFNNAQSIVQNGIDLSRGNNYCRFGQGFYTTEQGYSIHDFHDGGKFTVAFKVSKHTNILDIFDLGELGFDVDESWRKAILFGYDAIKYTGIYKKPGGQNSYSLVILKNPENLTPIGIYHVPDDYERYMPNGHPYLHPVRESAISLPTIRAVQALSAVGASYAAFEAVKRVIHSDKPIVEATHQGSLLAAAISGGKIAGKAAIIPCARVCKMPAPYTICLASASVLGSITAAAVEETAWHAIENVIHREQNTFMSIYNAYTRKDNVAKEDKYSITAAGAASLTTDALRIFQPTVSHMTSNFKNVQSILDDGIKLKSHHANLFGGKAFYVSEGGYALGEAKGNYMMTFAASRHLKVFDSSDSMWSREKPKKIITIAQNEGYHAIKYEGTVIKTNGGYNYNLAILNAKYLTPTGVYPVPIDSTRTSAISEPLINNLRILGAVGSIYALFDAGMHIKVSDRPILETAHQSTLLLSAIRGGERAGAAALKPCAILGAYAPELSLYTVPLCITATSILGGVGTEMLVNVAWNRVAFMDRIWSNSEKHTSNTLTDANHNTEHNAQNLITHLYSHTRRANTIKDSNHSQITATTASINLNEDALSISRVR